MILFQKFPSNLEELFLFMLIQSLGSGGTCGLSTALQRGLLARPFGVTLKIPLELVANLGNA